MYRRVVEQYFSYFIHYTSCIYNVFPNYSTLYPTGSPGCLFTRIFLLRPLTYVKMLETVCSPLLSSHKIFDRAIKTLSVGRPIHPVQINQTRQGAAVAEWLSSWLAEQEVRGSIPRLATWIFRDWLSPASKSRYG